MFKKLLISFIAAVILLQAGTTKVFAQDAPATWYNQGLQEWYLKVYDIEVSPPEEIFGERYTAAQVDWIIWSVITWIPTKVLRPEATACLIGVIVNSEDFDNCTGMFFGSIPGSEYYAQSEPRPQETLAQAIFRERSFSGIAYTKQLAYKLSHVGEANAQGFGYTRALEPFRTMWQASRDVAYSLFVFAAIILAFMVMFRVKLSPQTAVTVQSAVPKLIFALILVTFSYAIAGFLVDLMYVIIGLISIVGSRLGSVGGNSVNPVAVYNFMTLGPVVPNSVPGFGNTALGLMGLFFIYLSMFALTLVIVGLSLVGQTAGQIAAILTFIGLGVALLTGLWTILLLVFFVAFALIIGTVFVMFFKTWWTILKTFANIVLLTIFAPVQLLLGTFIPSMGFGSWVKSYISNLAVFVGVGFFFFLATIFLIQAMATAMTITSNNDPIMTRLYEVLFNTTFNNANLGLGATPGWPPLVTSSSSPANLAILYLIFSLVLFFQIPKVSDIIQSFIAGRPWSYGTAIGEGMGMFSSAWNKGPVGALRKESSEQTGATLAKAGAWAANQGRSSKASNWLSSQLGGLGRKLGRE